jgi:predicted ATP-grasp superfamily ATP-dependent carboligase
LKVDVFVTDGSYPNGLAAIRALGKAGFRVTVGERAGIAAPAVVGFWSRHCAERFLYPDPRAGETATVDALERHFSQRRYAAAVPVGLEMTDLFVRHRQRLAVPTMLPAADRFAVAADKRRTFDHAAGAGIPVPKTLPARRWTEIAFPVVFKHARSGAAVVRTQEEAAGYAHALDARIDEFIVQEFVEGRNGFGYFALFDRGRETGYFMHERLVQYPRDGGPSVVARAIRDARLHALGKRLLESLDWHGPAMVEFKRSDRDGEFYLMEINPKLWGSLDLAIAAGCNFPVWIVRALVDGSSPKNGTYAEGLTYQWTMPHGLKSFLNYPELRSQLLRNVLAREVRTDLCLSDPVATAAGLLTMSVKAVKG